MNNFDEIYKKYRPYVAAIIRSYVSEETYIDDIVQKTFIKLNDAKDFSYRDEGGLLTWLRKTATRLSIDYNRSVARNRIKASSYLSDSYNNQEPNTYEDSKILERQEITDYVVSFIYEEINKLPTKQQEIFKLYYFKNMTIRDIAARIGISKNTVVNQLYEARKRLRMEILFKKLPH